MKKYIFAFLLSLLVVGSAFAQKNPIQLQWVWEDSANGSSPSQNLWTISGSATGLDFDTSIYFSIANLPETGLGFQYYWNDADTGQIVIILQQSILATSYGHTFDGFEDTTDVGVTYISSWVYVDSLSLGDANGRGSGAWNPTLIGPGTNARLIIGRRSGTAERVLSIAAIKEY